MSVIKSMKIQVKEAYIKKYFLNVKQNLIVKTFSNY